MENCKHCAYLRVVELCRELQLNIEEIRSSRRKASLVFARWKLAYILHEERYTEKEIGNALNKNRTTINYYINRYTD